MRAYAATRVGLATGVLAGVVCIETTGFLLPNSRRGQLHTRSKVDFYQVVEPFFSTRVTGLKRTARRSRIASASCSVRRPRRHWASTNAVALCQASSPANRVGVASGLTGASGCEGRGLVLIAARPSWKTWRARSRRGSSTSLHQWQRTSHRTAGMSPTTLGLPFCGPSIASTGTHPNRSIESWQRPLVALRRTRHTLGFLPGAALASDVDRTTPWFEPSLARLLSRWAHSRPLSSGRSCFSGTHPQSSHRPFTHASLTGRQTGHGAGAGIWGSWSARHTTAERRRTVNPRIRQKRPHPPRTGG